MSQRSTLFAAALALLLRSALPTAESGRTTDVNLSATASARLVGGIQRGPAHARFSDRFADNTPRNEPAFLLRFDASH